MSKPRLAILHYSAPPGIGGVESTMRDHARLFVEHGYACKLIVGRGDAFDARVPVVVIPAIHSRDDRVEQVQGELAKGLVSPAFDALVAELRGALETALADVDVVLAHNVVTLHKNLALTVALHQVIQILPVRLIAWCHDFAWTDPVYAGEVHAGLPWALLREPWKNVQYVVVSEARRAELAALLQLDASEIPVVPPGLDAAVFLQLSATGAAWAKQFGLMDRAPLLLLPARVTRRKNIELALEVTAALRAQGKLATLLVMGPLGPHNPANRAYLDELHARRVELGLEDAVLFLNAHGDVDNALRRDLYALADALFFPSEREGFGIPILEAGLSRLPIFCADLKPFHESAQGDATYFRLDDAPARIAEMIVRVLETNAQYQLKRRVLDVYNWERIFKERMEPLLERG
jgi:glycosyltransferase involved in cell wall biosynthesis